MAVGTIKLFDKEKRFGCVQADGDRKVHFFHHGCIRRTIGPARAIACRLMYVRTQAAAD